MSDRLCEGSFLGNGVLEIVKIYFSFAEIGHGRVSGLAVQRGLI